MRNLSVLVIHNQYQHPAGEDAVVSAEVEMLRRKGNRVVQFTRKNSSIAKFGPLRKTSLLVSTTWDRQAYSEIREIIQKERPDVAHCHNLVPLVSPAAYDACHAEGVPVVQTLHNYRLLCPAGTLFAKGQICEACNGSLARGVAQGCYRNSRLQTAALAIMLSAHRLRRTWDRYVEAYLALSHFSRDYFIANGLPAEKMHVKPNFLVRDPGRRAISGDYALFVGRLSPEKGVLEMLKAWRYLPHIPLTVVGDGPLRDEALATLRESSGAHIKWLGYLGPKATRILMQGARFLIFPSRWYEPFGLTLLEAAACGVPAIAARMGGIPELVDNGRSGVLFDPEDPRELADKANWAWAHPSEMELMGCAARKLYQRNFTAERNYELLMNLYGSLVAN